MKILRWETSLYLCREKRKSAGRFSRTREKLIKFIEALFTKIAVCSLALKMHLYLFGLVSISYVMWYSTRGSLKFLRHNFYIWRNVSDVKTARCCWRFRSSGRWRRVLWPVFLGVSEDRIALIFTSPAVHHKKLFFLDCFRIRQQYPSKRPEVHPTTRRHIPQDLSSK